jgi:hypothetical protein
MSTANRFAEYVKAAGMQRLPVQIHTALVETNIDPQTFALAALRIRKLAIVVVTKSSGEP